MTQLVFSPAALADLDAIWDFSADKWSADKADGYVDHIFEACADLSKGRKSGRRVEIRDGYLKYGVGSHLIFYRKHNNLLEVIRILHGKMDMERHL
ncbi:MAG: type II toxin-antitoxin system RelE/ParE family toxin [Mesorhizobium sp.]